MTGERESPTVSCRCDGNPSGGACSYPDCQLPPKHAIVEEWRVNMGSLLGQTIIFECACGESVNIADWPMHEVGA